MQSNHRRAEATARTLAGEYGGTHRVGRAKAFILRTSALRFSPRPGSCRERPRRVTTSWSIPNSPPDGPQVFTCGPFAAGGDPSDLSENGVGLVRRLAL